MWGGVLAQNKCPLCGSRVINGSCSECGYTLPDEASIVAPYNYDPSDYNMGDKYSPAEREQSSMPEIRVYDKPADEYKRPAPEIKVGDRGGAYPAPRNNAGTYNAPQNNAGTYNAPQNMAGTYNEPQNNAGSYNAPTGQNTNPYANFDPTNNRGAQFGGGGKLSGAALTALIIGIILILVNPILGIVGIVSASKNFKKTGDEAYRIAMIILIVVFALRLIFAGITGG